MNTPSVGDIVNSSARPGVSEFLKEFLFLVVVGTAITLLTTFIIYPSFGLSEHAPQPARTVIVASVLIWLTFSKGKSFSSFGLDRFRPMWLLPFLVIAFLAFQIFVAQPIGDVVRDVVGAGASDTSFLTHIHGNALALIAWVAIAWVVGGFGEEILIRGYLMNRIGVLLGGGVTGWSIALFVQAASFGLLHFYLGLGGVVTIGVKALFSGLFFLLSRRNLWPLVFVHGLWDTLGITLVYLNGAPTT